VVLAQASTGIKGLDQIQGGSDVVYDRIALLLSTPLVGSSPALESAIYQVLAQVPGIESLGTMTDHSGRTGTAFTQPGSAFTLIVDTSTGSLLEIFEHPVGITDTTSGSSVGTEALLWLDPTNEQLISVANVPAITAH
jgi:ABC-type cobalamin transport system permease subunit